MRIPSRLLRSRHGVFYFRLVIPLRFRHLFGGAREVKRSLETTDRRFAFLCSRALSVQSDLAFCALDGDGMAYDPKRFDPNDPSTWPTELDDNRRFELEIGAHGVRFKTDPNNPKDAAELQQTLAKIAPQLGEIIKASKASSRPSLTRGAHPVFVTPPHAADIPNGDKTVEWVLERWRVANKRKNDSKTVADYEGMIHRFFNWMKKRRDTDEIVVSTVRAAEVADYVLFLQVEGLKDTTIDNKHLAALGNFFKIAVKHEAWPREVILPTANQRNLKKHEREEKTEPYEPFDADELSKIFAPETLLAQEQPHQFWLPLLGLFTGARLNELCQLAINDVRVIDGHWAISINDKEYKKLKNTASRRTIPLHPQLIELGFLNYIKDVKAVDNAKRIFPYLNQDTHGSFIKNPSKHFGEYLDLPEIAITHPKKVFHSFRSTANNVLKHAGVVEEERCEMIGHEHPTTNHLNYSEDFMVGYLVREVIPKFQYPKLNLKQLKYTQGRFLKELDKLMTARLKYDAHKAAAEAKKPNK